jgi:diguanylate cyclase (GGDEF)-like protein/PAS domain S-box-containing protein
MIAAKESKQGPHSQILVISTFSRDVSAIRDYLTTAGHGPFEVESCSSLTDGIERLKSLDIRAVILDLSLPDSQGITTFDRVSAAAPGVPILVITDDEDVAHNAVKHGAHDYLPRGRMDSYSIPRAVRTMISLNSAAAILADDRERSAATLNSIGDAVLSTDLQGRVTYLNAVAEKMTGWSLEEASGKPLAKVFRILDRESRKPGRNPLEYAIEQDQAVGLAADSVLIRRDGFETAIEDSAAPIRNHETRVVGAVIVFRDVGKAHALAHKMSHLAQHDPLTGLPNRVLLDDRLSQAIRTDSRHHKKLAVLFLDLDQFKPINDSLGHATGDELLRAVAKRMCETLRGEDTVCRTGGDEFVILLPEIEDTSDAARVAGKVLSRVAEEPYVVDGRELRVTASIGIAVYPDHGQSADVLLHCADLAMYEAKKQRGSQFRLCAEPLQGTTGENS